MNIAVTGLNATDNPGPGVPVIRSLKYEKSFQGKIIGLIFDSLEPGIYLEGIADKCYLIPYPSSGLENLFERIKYIHEKEKLDFIFPTLDSEINGFIKLQPRLEALGIKTYLPDLESLNIRGKDKLFDFCTKHKVKVPKNILITNHQDLYTIPTHFDYPVVVKGIFYEAYIANNFEEVQTAYNKIRVKWGFPLIVQEYINGNEFNVVALGDGKGTMVGAVAMRKLYVTDKGKGWSGITIHDPLLMELSEKLIEKLKWRSGMELEFMKSSDTGEYYLLEINPRFPAWVYLAPEAGQNLPWQMIRLAQGEKVETMREYKTGVLFVRCSWDLITDIKSFEKITSNGEFNL